MKTLSVLILSLFSTMIFAQESESTEPVIAQWSVTCVNEEGKAMLMVLSEDPKALNCEDPENCSLSIEGKGTYPADVTPTMLTMGKFMIMVKHPKKEIKFSSIDVTEFENSYGSTIYYVVADTEETGKVKVKINKE